MPRNLYVHFPFCRRKCTYCALHSRAGSTEDARRRHVDALVGRVLDEIPDNSLDTVYFGGGTPALCDLGPLLDALGRKRRDGCEFTVELHPLDVTQGLLTTLERGGVNRISMGLQSVDDAILADMGRGYSFAEAERAFALVRDRFDNAGIDLIVGYPGEESALLPRHARLAKWGLKHVSAYSLMRERGTLLERRLRTGAVICPDDDVILDRLGIVASFLEDLGLERYEISNYAARGFACRHNLAVWRGEDYFGFGEGAHGRVKLNRTVETAGGMQTETVSEDFDKRERTIFRLRLKEGVKASCVPGWIPTLDRLVGDGLLVRENDSYRLTARGTEVCDAVMSDLAIPL